MNNIALDVIIIGGSYAGLSAAMALGRSFRNVLIIDSGKPCNRQTSHAHNLITHDGETPDAIAQKAKSEVLQYKTIDFINDVVTKAEKQQKGFVVSTQSGNQFVTKKLLFATGVFDEMPAIPGFSECWGISVLHCPYCHGYEIHNKKTGLLASDAQAFEHAKFISHWPDKFTVFTNGAEVLDATQRAALAGYHIEVIDKKINSFKHNKGQLIAILFDDGSASLLDALFARPGFKQHCMVPEQLGCELTEQGLIVTNSFQQTTAVGVYAAGDNASPFRSLAAAISAGNLAGAMINKELIEESFA